MSQFIDQAKVLQLSSLLRDLKVSITPKRTVIPTVLPAKFTYNLSNESPFIIVYQVQSSGGHLMTCPVNYLYIKKQESSTFEVTHEKTAEIKSQLLKVNILPWIGKSEEPTTVQIKTLFQLKLPAFELKIKLSRPVEWYDHLMNLQSHIRVPNGISKICTELEICKNTPKHLSMNEFDVFQIALSNPIEEELFDLSSERKGTKTADEKPSNEK